MKEFAIFLRPYKMRVILIIMMLFFAVMLNMPVPLISKYLIDNVIPQGNTNMLNLYCFGIIGLFIVLTVNSLISNYILTITREKLLFEIRLKLFSKIHENSLFFFKKHGTGYLMSRIDNDPDQALGFLSESVLNIFHSILTFVIGVSILFYLHRKMALLSLLILPINIISLLYLNPRLRKQTLEIQEEFAQTVNFFQESFNLHYLVKIFAKEKLENIRFVKRYRKVIKAIIRRFFTNYSMNTLTSFAGMLGPIILLWYGGNEIINKKLTLGEYIAFSGYLSYLYSPISNLMNVNNLYQTAKVSLKRIKEILDADIAVLDGDITLANCQGKININKLNFSYPDADSNFKLSNISFSISNGESVALIGKSGSGKSTILNLLMRNYEAISGEILIDNKNIQIFKLLSLRKNIAIVPQDDYLFAGTIYDNILYGNPKANKEEVIEAARKAHAHEFISELTDDYQTNIAEKGTKLSGGQKQRISIARAILKNSPIIIFDEPTANLDSESEKYISQTIKELKHNKSILIIAHRLSTIRDCDKILVLDQGRIPESGTHDELIASQGIYAQIVKPNQGTVN